MTTTSTVVFSPTTVSVGDTLKLKQSSELELLLITPQSVEQTGDGSLMIGNVKLVLTDIAFAGTAELPEMITSASGKPYSIWGGKLTGIRLKTTSSCYKLDFIAAK